MLLGSGVSCAAGLPGTEKITEVVLAARDLPFLFGVDSAAVTAFMVILGEEIATLNKELARRRSPNYEDIYYLAAQICDSEFGEFENPAADAFARRLARILQKDRTTFASVEPGPGRMPTWQMRVIALAEAAQRLIVGDIGKALSSRDGVDIGKMQLLVDPAHALGDGLDVFTLNHDTLLEETWREAEVKFEDGFRPVQEVNAASWLAEYPEVTVWHRDAYHAPRSGPALFKLHGSVDWWRFDNPGVEYLPPTKIDGDPRYIPRRGPGPGPFIPPARPEPEILVGTFNKMLTQARGDAFSDLLCLFRGRLNHVGKLVIAGYGFGDKGINGMVIEWLSHRENRAVWIDPDPGRTLESARPAADVLRAATTRGQVGIAHRGIEAVGWEDVVAEFAQLTGPSDLDPRISRRS